MVEPRVLTKCAIRLRQVDPEVEHRAWFQRWFVAETRNGRSTYRCRVVNCSTGSSLKSPMADRQRVHVLQHFARPVCGLCLFSAPNLEAISSHFNEKHQRFGENDDGISGARFLASRANLPKLGEFLRAMGFSTQRVADHLTDTAGKLLLADYEPPQE